ncbi:MAG: aldo/keto reductase [Lutibacter sp.]|uniref:aldo/keto reductase n=1 Tax=Lutibacter sp. TaxID=1925666 RepID=UPI00299D9992|nr:aldo/keto reductase [Lutibacter sp.]MDX1829652.1 aldo/keto reductase [Lutibacter sp.]
MAINKVKLNNNFEVSNIIQGHWRLADWKLTNNELLDLTQQTIDLGITTFDHADIYGDYTCEQLFGDALKLKKGLRNKIEIITKCGIKLLSKKYPERKLKSYDYSFKHIVESVENSLKNFNTDYIDLLLLHRPSPYFNPAEVAEAFSYLKKQGKVLHFGVSNFNKTQFEMLNKFVEEPLVTNQVEISPYNLEHFINENIDYFLTNNIKPLAWSPLAGGNLLQPNTTKGNRIFLALQEVADELYVKSLDIVIYSWLLSHPSNIIPIVGTHKINRLQNAVNALDLKMNAEQWLKIYVASLGNELP